MTFLHLSNSLLNMCCIKHKPRFESMFYQIFVDFLIVFHCIQGKTIGLDDSPLTESRTQPSVKPQRLQSNAVLRVTPKVQVPFELTSTGVDTGITFALPIKVKFQSEIDLMSDWVKQFLTTKTNGLTKNFTSFSASLTQLFGLLNQRTNGGRNPNPNEPNSGDSPLSSGSLSSASSSVDGIDSDSNTFAAHSSESNLSNGGSQRKDSHKPVLQNPYANNSRAQARSFLFKSLEISHSTLGKSCLLRAICEVSQTPLMAPNTGLIGEILDMFLTINSLHESFADFEDYTKAQTVGQNSFIKQSVPQNNSFVDECRLYYGTDCPFSLFNINHIIPLSV